MSDPNKQYTSPEEKRINSYLRKQMKIKTDDVEIQQKFQEINQDKPAQPKIGWWQSIMQRPDVRYKYRQFNRFSRETLPMLLFLGFSTYMLIKMENQYDSMKQRIHNSKTLKQLEIEEEDAYIRAALEGKKINLNVQIQEPKGEQKYKFEDDGDDDLPGFDTEEDFYEGLNKDVKQGLPVPEEYQSKYQQFQAKQIPKQK